MKYKPDNDMLTKLTRMGITTPADGFDLDADRVAAFAAVLGDERRAAFRAIVELKDTGGLPDVPASQAMVPNATADQVVQVGPMGPAGNKGDAGSAGRSVQVFEQADEPMTAQEGDIWIIP